MRGAALKLPGPCGKGQRRKYGHFHLNQSGQELLRRKIAEQIGGQSITTVLQSGMFTAL